jgi:branched-chain amino acid transport system substrate-binding protein
VDAPIVGGDGLDTPNVLKSESDITTDVWFTTHAWLSTENGTPCAKAFVQEYENAYGHPPRDAFAALGYDSANLLLDAIGRAEGASPDQITAALAATRAPPAIRPDATDR